MVQNGCQSSSQHICLEASGKKERVEAMPSPIRENSQNCTHKSLCCIVHNLHNHTWWQGRLGNLVFMPATCTIQIRAVITKEKE